MTRCRDLAARGRMCRGSGPTAIRPSRCAMAGEPVPADRLRGTLHKTPPHGLRGAAQQRAKCWAYSQWLGHQSALALSVFCCADRSVDVGVVPASAIVGQDTDISLVWCRVSATAIRVTHQQWQCRAGGVVPIPPMSQRQRQPAEQRAHRRHHDRPEAQKAGFMDCLQ